MKGFMTVRFDHVNPASAQSRNNDVRGSLAGLDYSPLPRLTMRSLAMGCLVSMGGLIFGYDTGQISGFLEMPDFLDRFGMTNPETGEKYFSAVRSGLIVSLLSIGTLVGALTAAPTADRIGRKPSVWIWCLVTSVGFLVQIAAVSAWYQVMLGRFIAGLGVGALSLLVPMYQAETAPPWIRGAMVCAYQLFITMGIFLAATFNYGTYTHHRHDSASWRIVVGLGWIWTLVLGVGILAFPETPRYDFRHGNGQRATDTICKVYGAPANHWAVYTQVEEIESKLRAEDKVKQGPVAEFVTMFRAPKMAHRIALGVALQMFQQLTGANYFFYYGTTIFKSVQISSFITQIILNTINFLVTFIGLYIVEHFGRRKSLMAGSMWMFACFIIFATVGHYRFDQQNPQNTPTEGIVLIVFACLFILGFATTWGPMIWTIQAELFPSRYRAKGMALGTASNWIWNFCIGFFSTFIFNAIDFQYGYVFAVCNLVGGLIVFFFVIEGQGRTIEEIDTMYLEGVTPWKSSKWVPPSAEHMARVRREAGVDLETAGKTSDGDLSGHVSGDTWTGKKKETTGGQSTQHEERV